MKPQWHDSKRVRKLLDKWTENGDQVAVQGNEEKEKKMEMVQVDINGSKSSNGKELETSKENDKR